MRVLILGAALAALAFSPVLAKPATTNAGSDKMKTCAASWKAMSAADKKKTTYKAYSSDCMKGGAATTAAATSAPPTPSKPTPTAAAAPAATKPAPMTASKPAAAPMASTAKQTTMAAAKPAAAPAVTPAGAKPADATGVCKDGSYTKAKNHSGACSRHGGVDHWL